MPNNNKAGYELFCSDKNGAWISIKICAHGTEIKFLIPRSCKEIYGRNKRFNDLSKSLLLSREVTNNAFTYE